MNTVEEPHTSWAQLRLSYSLFFSDFLYAPEAAAFGLPNQPRQPELAVIAGRALATKVLEPLVATLGCIQVREGYLSPDLLRLAEAAEQKPDPARVWDSFDELGRMQAGVVIALPWLLDHQQAEVATEAMCLWIRAQLPGAAAAIGSSGCISLRWVMGAQPQSERHHQELFDQFGFPGLQIPQQALLYELWPPG